MNVKLLEKIKRHIMEEPKRLDMGNWGAIFDPKSSGVVKDLREGVLWEGHSAVPPCGAVGCIAGTCVILTTSPGKLARATKKSKKLGYFINLEEIEEITIGHDVQELAAKRLGITDEQGSRLFMFKDWSGGRIGWPEEFSSRYEDAKTPKQRAKVACERIDHFIKTKGAE